MGKIDKVVIDGRDVSEGSTVDISWSSKHYLTIYYDCEAWFTDCTCKFDVFVDGQLIKSIQYVTVPTEGGAVPVSMTLPEIPPGEHLFTVKSYEGAPSYKDVTDTFTFYVSVYVKPNQTQPTSEPEMPMQLPEIPWWVWLSAGIVGVALFVRATSPGEKLEELIRLKIMKELAEEEK